MSRYAGVLMQCVPRESERKLTMNKRIASVAALALLGWLALAGVSLADGPTIGWSVIGGGGVPASGGTVTLNSTLGQTASGPAGGGTVSGGSGYWYGAPAAAPAVAPVVTVDPVTGGAKVSWTHIAANAGGYEVYWSTAPYFTPDINGPDHAPVTAAPWNYTHTGVPGVNYYYVVLGVNGVGEKSQISNRTGRFNFALVKGTP
jgi:hypothetical protein